MKAKSQKQPDKKNNKADEYITMSALRNLHRSIKVSATGQGIGLEEHTQTVLRAGLKALKIPIIEE